MQKTIRHIYLTKEFKFRFYGMLKIYVNISSGTVWNLGVTA
jgi:hypothetical protein